MRALVGTTVREHLEAATARLAAAGVETARADAEWLLAGLLDVGRAALGLAIAHEVDAALAAGYEAALCRRERREPLQRILGWDDFRDLRLTLTPAVLVPRPETELLVEHALGLLPHAATLGRRPLVVDAGTGSGCIACALASERRDAVVVATDRARDALAVAAGNVRRLGLNERVRCVAADLLQPLAASSVDLVVANPPYLPSALMGALQPEVRDHEPRAALDGGEDGLTVVRRLVAQARRALRPGGALVLETAGGAQAAAVAALARTAGFVDVTVRPDLNGVDRYVLARGASPLSSAGFAGAILFLGEASEGAVEAPSDEGV